MTAPPSQPSTEPTASAAALAGVPWVQPRFQTLWQRHRSLRRELDAAYAQPNWDAARIDRIAEAMLSVERALCSSVAGEAGNVPRGA